MKKGLIRTVIHTWLNSKQIPANTNAIQFTFDHSRELYEHLRDHPDFPDLLPAGMDYLKFTTEMEEGVKIAQDPQYGIFRQMRRG